MVSNLPVPPERSGNSGDVTPAPDTVKPPAVVGSLPSVQPSADVAPMSGSEDIARYSAAIRAWAGGLARVDVIAEGRHVQETLIGVPEERTRGRGVHTDYSLKFVATITAPLRFLGVPVPVVPEREAIKVELRPPIISPARKAGVDFEVGLTGSNGTGSSERFPNYGGDALRTEGDLVGMARAAVYFKGAIIGGFVASQSKGIGALKERWRCPAESNLPSEDAATSRSLAMSIGSQLMGYGGISRDGERPPHGDYTFEVALPPGLSGAPRTTTCADGYVGIQATLASRPGLRLSLMLEMRTGRVMLSLRDGGRSGEHFVEQCAALLDFVPFAKGVLEGYRVGSPGKPPPALPRR